MKRMIAIVIATFALAAGVSAQYLPVPPVPQVPHTPFCHDQYVCGPWGCHIVTVCN